MILFLGLNVWFWIFVLVEFFALILLIENDCIFKAVGSIIVFLFGIWWLGKIPVWSWIYDNPLIIVKCFVGYLLVGMFYPMLKYFFHLLNVRDRIKELKKVWEIHNSVGKEVISFKKWLNDNYYHEYKFQYTTGRLITWAVFWPISIVWTIINDPIKRFFKFIVNNIFIEVYKKMHNKMINKFIDSV